MPEITEALTFNDSTATGYTAGSFTVDYLKTLTGATLDQTSLVYTELGVGDYLIQHPDITVRSVCRVHVTADASKYAVILFDPLDNMIREYTAVECKEPFTLADATATGYTLGNFTVNYCKNMAGTDISQTGTTLTELGSGDYVLMNPNITGRTACRLYVTAMPSKRPAIMFDPVNDAWAVSGTTDRENILSALASLLGAITVTNGYRTDIGENVSDFETTPLDPDTATLRLTYRDDEETQEYIGVGTHLRTLPVTLQIVAVDGTSLSTIRDAIADVTEAIGSDLTLGGRCEDINQSGSVTIDKAEAADVAAGATMKIAIEYTTEPWAP